MAREPVGVDVRWRRERGVDDRSRCRTQWGRVMSRSARQSLALIALTLSLAACGSGSMVTPPVATAVATTGGSASASLPATVTAVTATPNASLSSPTGLPTPITTSQQGFTHPLGDARPFVMQFLQAVVNGENLTPFLSPTSAIPPQGYDLAAALNLPPPVTTPMVRCQDFGGSASGSPNIGVSVTVMTGGGEVTIVVEMASPQPPWHVIAVNHPAIPPTIPPIGVPC